MAFGDTRVPDFDQYLKNNAIPISGVSQSGAAPAGITINFLPEATAEQITWANAARDSFDWRRRRAIGRNAIVTALANLTAGQQNAILRHAVAFLMRQNAPEMINIADTLGVALPVDEVDPTEVVPG